MKKCLYFASVLSLFVVGAYMSRGHFETFGQVDMGSTHIDANDVHGYFGSAGDEGEVYAAFVEKNEGMRFAVPPLLLAILCPTEWRCHGEILFK